jgi:DNA-directed RNA polymerase specialized sigma subunit
MASKPNSSPSFLKDSYNIVATPDDESAPEELGQEDLDLVELCVENPDQEETENDPPDSNQNATSTRISTLSEAARKKYDANQIAFERVRNQFNQGNRDPLIKFLTPLLKQTARVIVRNIAGRSHDEIDDLTSAGLMYIWETYGDKPIPEEFSLSSIMRKLSNKMVDHIRGSGPGGITQSSHRSTMRKYRHIRDKIDPTLPINERVAAAREMGIDYHKLFTDMALYGSLIGPGSTDHENELDNHPCTERSPSSKIEKLQNVLLCRAMIRASDLNPIERWTLYADLSDDVTHDSVAAKFEVTSARISQISAGIKWQLKEAYNILVASPLLLRNCIEEEISYQKLHPDMAPEELMPHPDKFDMNVALADSNFVIHGEVIQPVAIKSLPLPSLFPTSRDVRPTLPVIVQDHDKVIGVFIDNGVLDINFPFPDYYILNKIPCLPLKPQQMHTRVAHRAMVTASHEWTTPQSFQNIKTRRSITFLPAQPKEVNQMLLHIERNTILENGALYRPNPISVPCAPQKEDPIFTLHGKPIHPLNAGKTPLSGMVNPVPQGGRIHPPVIAKADNEIVGIFVDMPLGDVMSQFIDEPPTIYPMKKVGGSHHAECKILIALREVSDGWTTPFSLQSYMTKRIIHFIPATVGQIPAMLAQIEHHTAADNGDLFFKSPQFIADQQMRRWENYPNNPQPT